MNKSFWFLTAATLFGLAGCSLFIFWPEADLVWWLDNYHTPLEKEEATAKQTTLIFGGDVMLARTVEQKMLKYDDWAAPFREISGRFAQADLAMVNLESPFLDGGSQTPAGSVSFRALPQAVSGLELAGIDVVTLANNHFADQGQVGMLQTLDILTEKRIAYCGAGANNQEAQRAAYLNKNGYKFAYLGYAYPNYNLAGTDRAGINTLDIEQMAEEVNGAKQQADFVIVTMHAGAEYVYIPNQQQTEFAQAAVENGADLVIGHHPHVVQTYQQYKNGHIFYSLGNLVFDQEWSEPTTEGLVIEVTLLGPKIKSLEFLPVKLTDYHRPCWADEKTAQNVLDRLQVKQELIEID